MAELALGAVGVVPIIALAIKSYKSLCRELRTFRHCSSTVNRMHKKLKVQRAIFENECTFLLRDCLGDEGVANAMMDDPSHKGWRDKGQDETLRELLKTNYEVCAGLVEDIVEAAQQLESGLACFQELRPHKQKGEKMKDTWLRLKDGLRMNLNKKEYESTFDDLRVANSDLQALRQQVIQLRTPSNPPAKRTATPPGWSDIRRAAAALHAALAGAWSCGQAGHLRHFVKLFLEAEKAEEDVCMDIAILCHGYGRAGDASLIQLRVRSAYAAWTAPIYPSLGAGDERPRKRVKAVRFSGECEAYAQCATTKPQDASSDLRASGDFCSELRTRCQDAATRCLGHIDVHADSLRHSFYAPQSVSVSPSAMPGDLVPMDAFLHSAPTNFSTTDRLKIARSLVLAVLKFYATPWLSDAWRLRDFSLFHGGHGQDVSVALRTVHLGAEFQGGPPATAMEDVQPGAALAEDEQLSWGIRNVALHCLGAALLQIDMLERIDPGDVVRVRRAAKLGSSLGSRYREITSKCLGCDFGLGADLGSARLQKAVYEELIGALEGMISSLSIEDDG